MIKKETSGFCPLCKGKKKEGKTTFTVDLGEGIVVIRDVNAAICSQCGAEWISDNIAEKIENIVNEARKRHNVVEITSLSA